MQNYLLQYGINYDRKKFTVEAERPIDPIEIYRRDRSAKTASPLIGGNVYTRVLNSQKSHLSAICSSVFGKPLW